MCKQNVIYRQVQGFIQMAGDRKMNMKRIFQKIIVVLLTAVLWILPVQSVQAAGMSYSKASQLYTEAQCRWIAHPRKVKITDDLRARSGWFGNDTGKK